MVSAFAVAPAVGHADDLSGSYVVSLQQYPANPVAVGQSVTYTYTVKNNSAFAVWYPNVKDSSKGSYMLTDSACGGDMTIVSGVEYRKSGAFGLGVFGTSYGILAAGGTAVLTCKTSYSSEQQIRHRISVLNGKKDSKDGAAVIGTNSLYPSNDNPYETIVGTLSSVGNFQISQRVEYNPVVTGTTNHVTLTVTHTDTGTVYDKELTVTYQLPAANLKIVSATTEKGGTCAVNSNTNTVTCSYPAKAFGPSDSAQISVVTTAATPGVAHPTASITSQGQIKTLNAINDPSITVVDKTGTNTPGTTASSADTEYGSYSLTKMASTNYISTATKVTYTYVLRNNSKTDYISTAANAAATDVLHDSTCASVTYGDGWGINNNRHTIAPDSAATLLCSATVGTTTTNTATTKNLTFPRKSSDGTWTWDEAALVPVTAKNTVYFVGNTASDNRGTADDQNALTYQTPGTALPISCAVPYVWAAVSMNPTTKLESSETYLYGMRQNDTQFSLVPTDSNLYTGPGAYWQWGVGGTNLPFGSTTFYTGSGSNAFRPITNKLYSYNAMAYNKKDHLIYAVTNSDNNLRSGQLITIDGNNTIRRMGVYIPYPVWDSGVSASEQLDAKVRLNELQGTPGTFTQNANAPTGGFNAAFFDDDGDFYISQSSTSGTGNLYKFDLPSGKMTTVLKGTVQNGAWSDDYAYKDGYAYGIEYLSINDPTNAANYNKQVNNYGIDNPHSGKLEQINLKTGAIKYISLPADPNYPNGWSEHGYDVAWTYDGGDLGFLSKGGPNSENSDPQKRSAIWYRLRVNNPDSTNPTAEIIASGNARMPTTATARSARSPRRI